MAATDLNYDPTLPTPDVDAEETGGDVCGYPVDRTAPDWPGDQTTDQDGDA